jgi:DNA polymerase-3 subunit chi
LWTAKGTFLAHGASGGPHEARQPILLSDTLEAANDATFLILADGIWRQSIGFERVFLVFNEQTVEAARRAWRELDTVDGCERHFWRQQGARWSENGSRSDNPEE